MTCKSEVRNTFPDIAVAEAEAAAPSLPLALLPPNRETEPRRLLYNSAKAAQKRRLTYRSRTNAATLFDRVAACTKPHGYAPIVGLRSVGISCAVAHALARPRRPRRPPHPPLSAR